MFKNKWLRWSAIAAGAILLVVILNYEVLTRNSWNNWNLPLSGRVIVLDPGHGGVDGGAEGGKVKEKDIALQIAKKLKDDLQASGALVLMTREKDQDLADEDLQGNSRRKTQDLKRRAEMVKDSEADAMVSIHLNAIPSSQWRGAQTFYHPQSKENKKMAKFIQDSLRNELNNTNRVAKAINSIYLLKVAKQPSALVEVGFLSNPDERQLLNTDDYQQKVAASIYQGLMRYFTDEPVPELE
ncbi:N-acetylmuramoyl-L-alanine amidase CwlD [Tuberibacillus sp. Marseille-P3662]|uniref:N-acetylmuramoyl-L-alanine amidase CwlD n=1 Tax=Tuberibacillus sp. Marseille-P3662 TaxID=1965358 RepID=UPI000A1CC796|nr:N-acetylmuramoyl-L-alanine amidase CwlD [Tuberibacillus sp. Marseille-P3662]